MISDKFSNIQSSQIIAENGLIDIEGNGGQEDKEIEEQTFENQTNPLKKKGLYLENNELSNYTFEIRKTIMPPKEFKDVGSYQNDIDCFCVRYEKNEGNIAAGYSNGYIAIYNSEKGECLKYMRASEYPITSLRWKPYIGLKPKNILTTVTADGRIDFWHSSSGKILYSIKEEDNPIMCMDFNSDGTLFVTGGNDKVVRLYDDNTKCLITKLKSLNFHLPGHSNRIFTTIFNKDSDNMLISGGWDNTLQIYDIREKNIVASIYGPHICGDSIDIKGNKILTASWASENQIQIFDLRTFKPETTINWSNLDMANKKSSFLYTCQFAKFRNETCMFSVGGSTENQFACLDYNKKNNDLREIKICMKSKNNIKSAYTTDFSPNSREFIVGSGDGSINIVTYKER